MFSMFKNATLATQPALINTAWLGPTNVGKTTQIDQINKQLMMRTLPSGLQFAPSDPREVAQAQRDYRIKLDLLRQDGSPTTLTPKVYQHVLSEGDRQLATLRLVDIIGQVIDNTTLDSAQEEQLKYESLVKLVAEADVVWVGLSLGEPVKFEDQLNLVTAYLQEGLRRRHSTRPVSVLIQCLKADAAFPTEASLKEQFHEETVRVQLHGLITLVNRSPKVGEAAVVATSTLGFGKAMIKTNAQTSDEPVYILKPGTTPQPFNLMTVVLWSVLGGLLHHQTPTSKEPPELVRVCKHLATDLGSLSQGFIPLKGHLQLQ